MFESGNLFAANSKLIPQLEGSLGLGFLAQVAELPARTVEVRRRHMRSLPHTVQLLSLSGPPAQTHMTWKINMKFTLYEQSGGRPAHTEY